MVMAACQPEVRPPSEVVVRDSAGVRIVENASPETLPVQRVGRTAHLRFGWAEADPLLEDISAGVLLPDGGAAVLDAGSKQLLILTAQGTWSAHGRRGEGPGEFSYPDAVELKDDSTLVVWDSGLNRISEFSTAGAFIDSRQVGDPGIVDVTPYGSIPGQGLGWIPTSYSVTRSLDSMEGESGWLTGDLMLTGVDDSELRPIRSVPIVYLEVGGARRDADPFQRFGHGDVVADGFVWATNDRPEVRWISAAGVVRQVARWSQEATPVSDDVLDEYESAFLEMMGGSPERAPSERIAEMLRNARADASETLPYFAMVHASPAGDVWLSEYGATGPASPPRRFLAVEASGQLERWIEFRDPIRVLDRDADRVLGVELDRWGVQAVVTYPVRR
jgi:hypothetical protein